MTTEFFDSFDGTRLALHRHGAGRPFVLLHGLFSSAQMNWIKWGHHEAIAAQGFEVLMLDFRVHGDSAAPHDPDSYPSNVLVRDVAALVDHLDSLLSYGTMTSATKTSIANAVALISMDNDEDLDAQRERVFVALLLTVTSPDYLVQR